VVKVKPLIVLRAEACIVDIDGASIQTEVRNFCVTPLVDAVEAIDVFSYLETCIIFV
jgi:hypothetical protein